VRPYLEKLNTKRAGRVAQGVGSEFKPQPRATGTGRDEALGSLGGSVVLSRKTSQPLHLPIIVPFLGQNKKFPRFSLL
jgi:hypothetical protein